MRKMANISDISERLDVLEEKNRLHDVFSSYSREKLEEVLKASRLNPEGTKTERISRLVRYDLRRAFGAGAASWDSHVDNHPSRGLAAPGLDDYRHSGLIETRTGTSSSDSSPPDVPAKEPPSGETSTGHEGLNTNANKGTVPKQPRVGLVESPAAQSTLRDEQRITQGRTSNEQTHYSMVNTLATDGVNSDRRKQAIPPRRLDLHFDNGNIPFETDPRLLHPTPVIEYRNHGPFGGTHDDYYSSNHHFSQASREMYSHQDMLRCSFHPENSQPPPRLDPERRSYQSYFGNVTGTSNAQDSTYLRESRVCTLFERWQIKFSGDGKENVEDFIEKVIECQSCLNVPDIEIIRMIPVILSGSARYWARPLFRQWTTLAEFFEALRLQYGALDFQYRLEDEIRTRTQGPEEPIGPYLSSLQRLMGKMSPPMTLEAQLERAYRNMHPSLTRDIYRSQFRNFVELQRLGQQVEARRERERLYKPPPPPESSLFPETAYKGTRKPKTASIETSQFVDKKQTDELKAMVESLRQEIQKLSKQNEQYRNNEKRKKEEKPISKLEKKEARIPKPETVAPSKEKGDEQRHTRQSHGSPEDECWVCHKKGHWARDCKQKKGINCYKCGQPDVTIRTCPNCSDNSGNE